MLNLPIQLLNSLTQLPNFDKEQFIEAHSSENKLTSIRKNPFKKSDLEFDLANPVPWCEEAYYLKERPYFTHDPLFHAGCYYVQEASSMFIEYIFRALKLGNEKLNVLDACSAPGGKTTLLNSLLSKESLLVANEFIKSRADLLAYNLSKWGTCNTIVTNNNLEKFNALNDFFDLILVDAPCSGSGLFRKQPEAIDEWSESAVMNCSLRQKEIIEKIITSLKNDGHLIYSTCSYSLAENEAIVQWMISEFDLEEIKFELNPDWGIVSAEHGYRFYPHLTSGEGFYCAILKKRGDAIHQQGYKSKKTKEKLAKAELEVINKFTVDGDFEKFKVNNFYYFSNYAVSNFIENFGKQFYIKKAGTCVGEIKGRDLIPNHELALSNYLLLENLKTELNLENAIKFLKKENFSNLGSETGLRLITHKNYGIGWAKVLPNRINNYLPAELRVLR